MELGFLSKNKTNKTDMYTVAATFFAVWTMIVTPLWLNNKYHDAGGTKAVAFFVNIIITSILLIIAVIKEKDHFKPLLPQKDITEYAILIFGIFGLLSSFLSGYIFESFTGYNGWCVGGLQLFAFAIFVILLSKKLRWSDVLKNIMLVVGYIVFIIGLLQAMDIDCFYLYKDLIKPYVFISTIGNINLYVGYLCLTVPIFAVLFMNADNNKDVLLFGIYMFLACMGITTCRSDGVYAGIGICAFFAIPFVMSNAQRLSRCLLCIGFFGLSTLMISTLPMFRKVFLYYNGISLKLLDKDIDYIMIIVGFIGFILTKKFYNRIGEKTKKALIILLEGILFIVLVGIIVHTVKTFNTHYGTERGSIWIYSIDLFKKLPLSKKLIGTGPETLYIYNTALVFARNKLPNVNHSDFFQFLITNGIVGLTAWMTMWISIVVKFVKRRNIEGSSYMFLLAAMAYFGQSSVNTISAISAPILCVVIGLMLHYFKLEKEETNNE